MGDNRRRIESQQTPSEEQWNYYLCVTGVLICGMSLILPGMGEPPGDVIPGYLCMLIGFYWYPSNVALLLSPIVATWKDAAYRVAIGVFLLISCFYTFVIVTMDGMQQPRVGFWLWLSSFVISGIGLLVPIRLSANRV